MAKKTGCKVFIPEIRIDWINFVFFAKNKIKNYVFQKFIDGFVNLLMVIEKKFLFL